METCIIIFKLVGILNSNPVDLYKLDCGETEHSVIVQNKEFVEVNILGINRNLTYNIEIK